MMIDASNLAESINKMLVNLNEHHAAAKKAIDSVRPDLDEAKRRTQAAHRSIYDLGIVILRADSFLGIATPPDVVYRIQTIQRDIMEVENEIASCNSVLAAHEKRIADPRRVAN